MRGSSDGQRGNRLQEKSQEVKRRSLSRIGKVHGEILSGFIVCVRRLASLGRLNTEPEDGKRASIWMPFLFFHPRRESRRLPVARQQEVEVIAVGPLPMRGVGDGGVF